MNYRHTPAAHPDPCPWLGSLAPDQLGAYEESRASWAAGEVHCQGWGQTCEKTCARRRALDREKQRQARAVGPRVFPPLPPQPAGHCRWCAGAILKAGQLDRRRGWHDGRADEPHCLQLYYLHTRSADQYRFLVKRDGERCHECGKTPLKVVRGTHYTWRSGVKPYPWRDWWGDVGPEGAETGEVIGPYVEIEIKPGLEVEHQVPLWSVAHLEDRFRRAFFGPDNLRLYCGRCHKKKTRREAAERGHGDRLIRGPKVRKGRAIAARADGGWDKRYQRPMGGKPMKKQKPKPKAKPRPQPRLATAAPERETAPAGMVSRIKGVQVGFSPPPKPGSMLIAKPYKRRR